MNRVHVNQIDIDDYIYFLDGKPYTGVMYETYPNGKLSTEQTLRMGVPDGPMRIWLRNGILACEKNYKMGRIHGMIRIWSANNKLRSETQCELGIVIARRKWNWAGNLVEDLRIDPAGSEAADLERKLQGEPGRIAKLEAKLSAARFTPDDEPPEAN